MGAELTWRHNAHSLVQGNGAQAASGWKQRLSFTLVLAAIQLEVSLSSSHFLIHRLSHLHLTGSCQFSPHAKLQRTNPAHISTHHHDHSVNCSVEIWHAFKCGTLALGFGCAPWVPLTEPLHKSFACIFHFCHREASFRELCSHSSSQTEVSVFGDIEVSCLRDLALH